METQLNESLKEIVSELRNIHRVLGNIANHMANQE